MLKSAESPSSRAFILKVRAPSPSSLEDQGRLGPRLLEEVPQSLLSTAPRALDPLPKSTITCPSVSRGLKVIFLTPCGSVLKS